MGTLLDKILVLKYSLGNMLEYNFGT